MTHEKSKSDNVKAIEALLPSLSAEEQRDMFAQFKFDETSKFAKQENQANSLKRQSMAFINNLDSEFKKVQSTMNSNSLWNTNKIIEKAGRDICY